MYYNVYKAIFCYNGDSNYFLYLLERILFTYFSRIIQYSLLLWWNKKDMLPTVDNFFCTHIIERLKLLRLKGDNMRQPDP